MKTITNTTPNMFNYINKPVDDKTKAQWYYYSLLWTNHN